MQQCLGCLGVVFRRRNSSRLRYKVNYGEATGQNDGLEFENLFSDDDDKYNYGTTYNFVTKEEKDLISKKQYDKIVKQQKAVDDQIRAQTFKEEEQLKFEEDSFNEAQKEANRAAMAVGKLQETSSTVKSGNGHGDYNLFSNGIDSDSEDDFEAFLESVKQRSEAFRSDKGSFCDTIPASTSTIIAQPKKFACSLHHNELPERDGNADGRSSDGSFTFDEEKKENLNDNTEWDTFVTGVGKEKKITTDVPN